MARTKQTARRPSRSPSHHDFTCLKMENNGNDEFMKATFTAWFPPAVSRRTLDDNWLHRYCPLDNGGQYTRELGDSQDNRMHLLHRTSYANYPQYTAQHDLGLLERFPREILNMILLSMDLRSLTDFRRVSKRALLAVDGLPQYASIIKCAPNTLRGILSIETGRWTTCLSLFNILMSPFCETCGDFGAYVYILTCKRVCYLCFTQLEEYLPLSYGIALRRFGLLPETLDTLPHMRSRPGVYSPRSVAWNKRRCLVDYVSARDYWLATKHEDTSLILDSATYTLRNPRRRVLRAVVGNSPETSDQVTINPMEESASRFVAIVETPCVLGHCGHVQWGRQCVWCSRPLSRDVVQSRQHDRMRRFSRETFATHMRECHPEMAYAPNSGSQEGKSSLVQS